jgi:hypothetical protein
VLRRARTGPGKWEVNGILFVGGRSLQAWLEELDGEEVSENAAKQLVAELRKFRVRTHEAQDTVRPPTLPQPVPQVNLAIAGGISPEWQETAG